MAKGKEEERGHSGGKGGHSEGRRKKQMRREGRGKRKEDAT